MDAQAVRGLSRTAASFADRFVGPMMSAPGRDGDLDALPAVLAEAAEVGVLATTDPDGAGHEYGVWGTASLAEGPAASLGVLEAVARHCAGVAGCLHAAGLGAIELAGSELRPGPLAVAFLEDGWRLDHAALAAPPAAAARLERGADGAALTGRKSFVLAPPGCAGFVVYAVDGGAWRPVLVPADAPGVDVEPRDERTGLAAIQLCDLRLGGAPIAADHLLAARPPGAMLARLWLGLAAIALGNARGALAAAREYAADRYQGGGRIEVHPAVRGLLGEAASRIASAAGLIARAGGDGLAEEEALWRAAAAKLRVTADCAEAVSDCLQVLGGYGYMEEFRVEKRLRDALTLKLVGGSPGELRRLLGARVGGLP